MSPLISALTAIGIGAGIGAGIGGVTSGIMNLIEGKTPWDDPGEWFSEHFTSGAKGAATGALTSGVGQMLGPAAESIGVGTNAGTIPAAEGAATQATTGGVINPVAGEILKNAGTPVAQNTAGNVIKHALGRTVMSAATGTLNNPRNPGQGALMGAASSLATSGFNAGTDALFRGQGAGIINEAGNRGFSLSPDQGFHYNPDAQAYSLARESLGAARPTLAERLGSAAQNVGGRMVGRAAGMGVAGMTAPSPQLGPRNPYEAYGRKPYWMGSGPYGLR